MNKNIRNLIIILIIIVLVITVYVLKKEVEKNNDNLNNDLNIYENNNNINNENNDKNNEDDLTKTTYTLYNFGSESCYYCKVMEPIYEKCKKEYTNITFKYVDISDSPDLAKEYNVLGTPTFIVVDNNGKLMNKLIGAVSEERFRSFVVKYNE